MRDQIAYKSENRLTGSALGKTKYVLVDPGSEKILGR